MHPFVYGLIYFLPSFRNKFIFGLFCNHTFLAPQEICKYLPTDLRSIDESTQHLCYYLTHLSFQAQVQKINFWPLVTGTHYILQIVIESKQKANLFPNFALKQDFSDGFNFSLTFWSIKPTSFSGIEQKPSAASCAVSLPCVQSAWI